MDATDMRIAHGAGPAGARCTNCEHLVARTGERRTGLDGRAHKTRPLTIFFCSRADTTSPWSVKFGACALFRKAA